MTNKCIPYSVFTDFDVDLFRSGLHYRLYEKLGAHPMNLDGVSGYTFSVYAPGAKRVEVIGDFNGWDGKDHILFVRWDHSGIWEGFIPGFTKGQLYKFRIYSHHDEEIREKADPFAFATELMPRSASMTWDHRYQWKDSEWMENRPAVHRLDAPMSIYEMHIGSWKKSGEYSLGYRELATELVNYLQETGFTHVEFLPLTEHPFYPSWGYLTTSYFAPTSRYGSPDELMLLIDALHSAQIGVIMDWVPAHFPSDAFALADFDGTRLYEHPNPRKGFHPDWNSLIFNYERPEIVSFLISSAHFWLDKFHLDGLRVDAVSSMLYLDYSREEGEWEANEYGGNEYLAAIDFLRKLNTSCYQSFPGIHMIAEESTAYPGVTKPVDTGGLGFGLKWMMGWMNDTLSYMSRDPIHRNYHHNEISFSMAYAWSENFLLPLSHDEVVHGKQALLYKMPGDEWQRFANLRLLLGYMFCHPGQKLLFMGSEFGQTSEWQVDRALDWHLLQYDLHRQMKTFTSELNRLLRSEPALHRFNFDHRGFEWIDHSDHKNCILAFLRKSEDQTILVICNFLPAPHTEYRLGVPSKGTWRQLINSDDPKWGGSGFAQIDKVSAREGSYHGQPCHISLDLSPLSIQIFKHSES